MPKLPIFVRRTKGGAYWYCYVYTPDRRRHQRALHIRADGSRESERAATDAYWNEQARATSGEDARSRAPKKTLGQAIKALTAAQVVDKLSENTLSTTFFQGRNLVDHFGEGYDLTQLTSPEPLVEYASQALKKRVATTVKCELAVLRSAMKAVGLVMPKPPKLKGAPKPQEPLTEEEQRRLLMAATPQHKLTILLLLTLGPRRNEVRVTDEIDWEKQTMWIRGTKTNKSNREVPIPDELFEEMEARRRAGTWTGFPKVTGSRIGQVVRATCKRAGISRRSPNDLRGTASQRMRAAGVDAEVRAAVQGNSPKMQERTYTQTHTMVEVMREAVNATKRLTRPKPCITGAAQAVGETPNMSPQNETTPPKPLRKP